MQVLHRNGEDRDKLAASLDAGSATFAPSVPEENIIADDELEIRASHITAAAVAAAAVTAAVVTEAAAAAAETESRLAAAEEPAVAVIVPQAQPQLQAQPRTAEFTDYTEAAVAHEQGGSTRAAWPVSLLTLAVIGLALWWSAQWPWPHRALQPMVQELPSLRKPVAPAVPAAAPVAPVATDTEAAPARDEIAILQQEAEDKAQLLAQKHAATEARHHREDAAQALREQRRRDAEAQLAAARAKAERSQAAVLATPEVVEVAPAPSLADQVQQCRALSLFSREGCLWKLCSGQWGKNGCPAYEQGNNGGA